MLIAALFLLAPGGALAQTEIEGSDPADAGAFIAGLVELELGAVIDELVKHPPKNPDRAKALRDALASSWLADQNGSAEQYLDALKTVLAFSRKAPQPTVAGVAWAEPIWASDLAEALLFRSLPSFQNAGDFVLLGVPTRGQLDATTEVAGEVRTRLDDAEGAYYTQIKPLLPRQPNFTRDFINTGRWGELTDRMKFDIPYNRAWASLYLIAGEPEAKRRTRLLRSASADVKALMDQRDGLPLNDEGLARLDTLAANLAIERGNSQEAIDAATRAARFQNASGYARFIAKLTHARALQLAGRNGEAMNLLNTMAGERDTTVSPYRMVLVADRKFQLIKAEAEAMAAEDQAGANNEARASRLADAFAVYEALIESDAAEKWAGPLRAFIEQRYDRQVPTWATGELLPPTVRFAGIRRDIIEAQELSRANKLDEANTLYQRVIEESRAMLEREGDAPPLDRDMTIELRFFLAFSLNQTGDVLNALDNYLILARDFPDSPRGEQAIRVAYTGILRPAYVRSPENAQLVAKMELAFEIIFENYPQLPLAQLAQYHYAALLREQNRYMQAIAEYRKIDKNHPNYFAARYEELVARAALWQDPPAEPEGDGEVATDEEGGGDADGAAGEDGPPPGSPEEVVKAASAFIELAEKKVESSDPAVSDNLKSQLASAYLIRAQVRIQDLGGADVAMKDIDQVAQRFGDVEGMENRITQIRIRALQQQGEFVEAEQLLRDYMERQPEQAAPLAAGVLKGLAAEAQRRAARGEDVESLVEAVVRLADKLVLPWARDRAQQFTFPQKLAFELQPVDALMVVGRWQDALDRVNGIIERYGQPAETSLDLVMAQARCQFHLGDLNVSHKNFTRVYEALVGEHNKAGGEKAMRPQFWDAALHMVRIQDRLAEGETNPRIASFVQRLLQNESYGEPPERFADPLAALRAKHRR